MRSIALSLSLIAGLHAAAWGSPGTSENILKDFDAVYSVERGSLIIGETHYNLTRGADHTFTYRSHTEPVGLVSLFRDDIITETSHFTVHDGMLQPLNYLYQYVGASSNKDQRLDFDWKHGTAHSDYRGSKSEVKIQPGDLDRSLIQLAVSMDLAGAGLRDTLKVIDHGSRQTYHVTATGKEQIKTPAGTFDAVRVERRDPDSSRVTVFWCAPALDYLAVKMEQRQPDKPVIRLELRRTSLQRH